MSFKQNKLDLHILYLLKDFNPCIKYSLNCEKYDIKSFFINNEITPIIFKASSYIFPLCLIYLIIYWNNNSIPFLSTLPLMKKDERHKEICS